MFSVVKRLTCKLGRLYRVGHSWDGEANVELYVNCSVSIKFVSLGEISPSFDGLFSSGQDQCRLNWLKAYLS